MVQKAQGIAQGTGAERISDKVAKKVIQNLNGKGSWRSASPNSKPCSTCKPHLQGSLELVRSLLDYSV